MKSPFRIWISGTGQFYVDIDDNRQIGQNARLIGPYNTREEAVSAFEEVELNRGKTVS